MKFFKNNFRSQVISYNEKIKELNPRPLKQLKEVNSMNKKIEMLKKANLLDKKGKVKEADIFEKKAQNEKAHQEWLERQKLQKILKNFNEDERNKVINKKFFEQGLKKYGLPPNIEMLKKQRDEIIKNTPEGLQFNYNKFKQQLDADRKHKELAKKTYLFYDRNKTWWDRLQSLIDPINYTNRTLVEYN